MDLLEKLSTWQGSPKEAIGEIQTLIKEFGLELDVPSERVLRDWRNEGILTKGGRKLSGQNLLESIRAKQLRDRGLPVALIRESISELSMGQLLEVLGSREAFLSSTAPDQDQVERAVILLSHGILKQYQLTQDKKIVGIYEDIPVELQQAQAYLARLAMEGGQEDCFASIHELLVKCCKPLGEWAPKALAESEEYADMILIDPNYRVPSEDCQDYAARGGHLEDLIETQLHRDLMRSLERMDKVEREMAYTRVRQFIGEHPMADRDQWQEIREDSLLLPETVAFLEKAYQPAHAQEARQGVIPRCAHCHGPLKDDGRCRLRSCRARYRQTEQEESVPLARAWIARPEILRYWCDPAQEELLLFRSLQKQFGDRIELYPGEDTCDVAIGSEVGIDVKDYRNPVQLARKLNGSLGGLRHYPKMVLAVASHRAREGSYIPRLIENLLPSLRHSLKVCSVDEAIEHYTGDHHD